MERQTQERTALAVVRDSLITLALDRPELSPRELAVTFTDSEGYFVSESSVYRLLHIPAQNEHPFRFIVNTCSGRT